MVGTETLAIVTSSTARKLAMARRIPIPHSDMPERGAARGWAPGPMLEADMLAFLPGGGPARSGRPAPDPVLSLSGSAAGVDGRGHRQPDAERVAAQLGGVEADAHGDALHHLDPVAGRILGRDQGEGGACAAAEPGDAAVEDHVLAVEIGMELDRLVDADLGQLAFLEIGVDISVLHRDHAHQGAARLHALADLDLSAGDDAGDRGAD